jgi:acyl-CoA thioesterase-1
MRKFYTLSWLTALLLTVGCGNHPSERSGTTDAPAAANAAADVPSASATKTDSTQKNTAIPATKTILFFGNSLTAGYGVNPSQAFPALIRDRIDSLKLPYNVVNAGLSGETSAGGKGRIGWILRQPVDIFVLELGANDGLRGIPISETVSNLQAILDSVKGKYPSARLVLAGMQIPPSMGSKYTTAFRDAFHQLADKNKVFLIPFILEGVGGVPELNQADGIHPTPKGHKIVEENVWKILKPLVSASL